MTWSQWFLAGSMVFLACSMAYLVYAMHQLRVARRRWERR